MGDISPHLGLQGGSHWDHSHLVWLGTEDSKAIERKGRFCPKSSRCKHRAGGTVCASGHFPAPSQAGLLPNSTLTQLWVCFLLNKHRRFPSTLSPGPCLLTRTVLSSKHCSSTQEMRFLPRLIFSAALGIATFLSWRLLLRSPATGQRGNARAPWWSRLEAALLYLGEMNGLGVSLEGLGGQMLTALKMLFAQPLGRGNLWRKPFTWSPAALCPQWSH